jgi:template-activating factor I
MRGESLTDFNVLQERQAQAYLRPLYEKRRQVIKTIPNFWPVAMLNNTTLECYIQHNADKTALSYLEDIWVEKDAKEHRCFTIEFVGGRAIFFVMYSWLNAI